jgi:hypothetical protein
MQATAEQALHDLRVEKEGLAQALGEMQQQDVTARQAAKAAEGRVHALEAELAEECVCVLYVCVCMCVWM